MEQIKFELKSDYIELMKLLKLLQIAESGGQAKLMIENGEVVLNGNLETRKRAKLRKKDILQIFDFEIIIE